jgi:hypothetical protein
MPSTTVKLILPDGTAKETSADKVLIKETKENWSEYLLEDGALVRVKPILARVLKTEEFDSEGNPVYQLMISNAVFVEAPEELKKKKGLTK